MAPKQKPGNSKQDYRTPPEFLDAVRRKLNIYDFSVDLAASDDNHVCPVYMTKEDDALGPHSQWHIMGGWQWLNPPYAHIRPWVAKCWAESQLGARIACLVPAGIGSNWYKDYVLGKAHTLILNGRITFVGCDAGYPKDLMLLLYEPNTYGGTSIWSWQ